MVLALLAMGVTGCGAVLDQLPAPSATTVSPDALAEYQQIVHDAGFDEELVRKMVKRAEALCNDLYLASDDALIESALIGKHERRYDELVRTYLDRVEAIESESSAIGTNILHA